MHPRNSQHSADTWPYSALAVRGIVDIKCNTKQNHKTTFNLCASIKCWIFTNECHLKLHSIIIFGKKMIRYQYLSKYITSQCSKLSPYFSPIHNGKLIIMFSNLSDTVGFVGNSSMALRHYVTSVNMKKLSWLLGYRMWGSCRCRDAFLTEARIIKGVLKRSLIAWSEPEFDCSPLTLPSLDCFHIIYWSPNHGLFASSSQ